MGVEVVGEGFPLVPLMNGSEGNSPKSLCLHEKDAVDECPEPKRMHHFYFIKYPSFEDPKLKSQIDQADEDLRKKTEAWFGITVDIKAKKVDREVAISQLDPLTCEHKRYRKILDENRKGIGRLHEVLVKLHDETNTSGEKGDKLCSSEEELNNLIRSLHFQTKHGSNTLAEEKQLLSEIKQFEGTRDKVIANAIAFKNDTCGWTWKREFRDLVEPIDVNLDGIRKEKHLLNARIQYLKKKVKALDSELSSLDVKLTAANKRRIAAYEVFFELKRQRDQGNAYYYQNRSLLKNVRKLAAEKNVAALEELCCRKVEKFMSLWSSNKALRNVYVNRMLPSLDSRRLSRDGRIISPDEKPLISYLPTTGGSSTVTKPNIRRPKEDSKPRKQDETLFILKVQKEEDIEKLTESESTMNDGDDLLEEKGKCFELEKPEKEISASNEIDATKLKDIKREEEIAKAKVALERKKKLTEKAAANKVLRAQKEAEKKLREPEKRLRNKKNRATLILATKLEQNESDEVVVELENVVEAPVLSKSNEQKENTTRYRNRSKGQEPIPKVGITRKKLTSQHWPRAAPTALLVAMLVVLGYYYD